MHKCLIFFWTALFTVYEFGVCTCVRPLSYLLCAAFVKCENNGKFSFDDRHICFVAPFSNWIVYCICIRLQTIFILFSFAVAFRVQIFILCSKSIANNLNFFYALYLLTNHSVILQNKWGQFLVCVSQKKNRKK